MPMHVFDFVNNPWFWGLGFRVSKFQNNPEILKSNNH
jgi:hypothetical protein